MQFKLRLSVGLIARVTLLDLGLTVVGEVAPESKGTDSPEETALAALKRQHVLASAQCKQADEAQKERAQKKRNAEETDP